MLLQTVTALTKPISARLTVQDQPEVINATVYELCHGMDHSNLYLASCTRPDIAYSVSERSRFVSNPGKPHLEAGFMFMLNSAAISWRSKRQPTLALSSAGAEFTSASALVQGVIYLRKFMANLGVRLTCSKIHKRTAYVA
jgi:hypothetical protein